LTSKNDKISDHNHGDYEQYDYSDIRKQRNKKRNKKRRHRSKDILRDVKNGNIDYDSFEEWSEFQ
tara:strand:- start:20836 stop:21030 length:195 start_codon:yes stop_codon:yes gene_type:complete